MGQEGGRRIAEQRLERLDQAGPGQGFVEQPGALGQGERFIRALRLAIDQQQQAAGPLAELMAQLRHLSAQAALGEGRDEQLGARGEPLASHWRAEHLDLGAPAAQQVGEGLTCQRMRLLDRDVHGVEINGRWPLHGARGDPQGQRDGFAGFRQPDESC